MSKRLVTFIISHGRPDRQVTLNSLLEANYTGDWYIVCDDEDETLDEYLEIYGDKILIFNKREMAQHIDLYTNNPHYGSAVYAREATFHFGKELGYEYQFMLDDDLTKFIVRYESEGKLKSKPLLNMDEVLDIMMEMMDGSDLAGLGFTIGSLIGGLNGGFKNGMSPVIGSTYLLNIEEHIKFRGLVLQDTNTFMEYHKLGRPMMSFMAITAGQPPQGTNEGGMKGFYDKSNKYVNEFYGMITSPAYTLLYYDGDKISPRRFRDHQGGKIISEKWRKQDA